MKDHLIQHIAKKRITKEMYYAFGTIYQSVNVFKKTVLRNKLTMTRMSRTNTIASYLMNLAEMRDQLGTVGDKVKEEELV